MSLITRPMLAASVDDVNKINFPVLVTRKLDGIRCLIVDGKAVTRKFKPVPNHHIRETLERLCPEGFDGEIMCPGKTFNEVQSLVMSEDGAPEFEYWVFDYVNNNLNEGYEQRCERLRDEKVSLTFIKKLLPEVANTLEEFNELEQKYVSEGYEGIILRSPNGPYKCNRSTLREGYLLKLKRFADAEATIIGFDEKMHNANVKETNELGLSKRSSKLENLVPANTLGALIVVDMNTQQTFNIGSGFNDALKKEIWDNQKKYNGMIVKYKCQKSGAKDLPRFPVFLGFRDERDM